MTLLLLIAQAHIPPIEPIEVASFTLDPEGDPASLERFIPDPLPNGLPLLHFEP